MLSKVPEEKKQAFIKEIFACRTKAERLAGLEKFGIQLTEKELEALSSNEITDEELALASGGCELTCCDPFSGLGKD